MNLKNSKKKLGLNGVAYAKQQQPSLKVTHGAPVSAPNSATLAYYLCI